MNEQLAVRLLQSVHRKRDSAFKQLRRLGLKIVIGCVPQNLYPVRLSQWRIVKLNLHIDDVGYPHASHFCHVLFIPDPTAKPDSAGDPSNIHPQFPFPPVREVNSASSLGRYKSGVALQRFGQT
jgi:hypothetical protein